MLQGVLWLFDDAVSDLQLAGIFVVAALHHRQMRHLQRRTNQLAFQVSELKMLIATIPIGFLEKSLAFVYGFSGSCALRVGSGRVSYRSSEDQTKQEGGQVWFEAA